MLLVFGRCSAIGGAVVVDARGSDKKATSTNGEDARINTSSGSSNDNYSTIASYHYNQQQ